MMLALARLLRLSLLPSALADVAAGLVVGSAGAWPEEARLSWLFPAAAMIYHGALALNDWCDREGDARSRPSRPLPAGEVSAATALGIALTLLTGGALLGFLVSPWVGLGSVLLALLAAFYDLFGRGAWRGPLCLAACRALNLALPIFAAQESRLGGVELSPLWLAPLLYGSYVFLLSRVARLEDAEESSATARPDRALLAAALCLSLAPLTLSASAQPASLLCAFGGSLFGAHGLIRVARVRLPWNPAQAGKATGMALRRLLLFTASVTLASWSGSLPALLTSAAILAGYPLSFALRRILPPT